VARGYNIGQRRFETFPTSQGVLVHSTDIPNESELIHAFSSHIQEKVVRVYKTKNYTLSILVDSIDKYQQ
jgi:hypothetical protein